MTAQEFFKNDLFAENAGVVLLEVRKGYSKAKLEIKPEHLNAGARTQGGAIFTLADLALAAQHAIKDELESAEKTNAKLDAAVNRIDEMTTVMYGLKNHPVEYDEQIVRQLISSIKVVSAEQILILFKDGTEMTADL